MKTLNILSIDAWNNDGSWDWNQWYKVGTMEQSTFKSLKTTRKVLAYMRSEGYLANNSQGKCTVEDDQYNLVICDRRTGEPLFAIEYGPIY